MADTFKVLGQAVPSGGALTTLYTVPGATSTTISSLMVCNESGLNVKFRVSVAVAGAADTAAQYIYYDVPLGPGETFAATLGITLAATDVVRCYASSALVAFNLFGVEVT